MPYDPAGLYSLPPSYRATAGQTIRTEQHNPPLEDIAAALSSVLVRDGRNGMVGPLDMGGFPLKNVGAGGNVALASQLLPIGAVIDFAGPSAPTGWLLCAGQAVSRSTYAALFEVISTTYGAGDGSTTFNVPDAKGRATAGRDNMGGTAANRLTSAGSGIVGITLGASGGAETHTLTAQEAPVLTYSFQGNSLPAHSHKYQDAYPTDFNPTGSKGIPVEDPGGSPNAYSHDNERTTDATSAGTPTGAVTANAGGQAHRNVQPTLVMNKIIKAAY